MTRLPSSVGNESNGAVNNGIAEEDEVEALRRNVIFWRFRTCIIS